MLKKIYERQQPRGQLQLQLDILEQIPKNQDDWKDHYKIHRLQSQEIGIKDLTLGIPATGEPLLEIIYYIM